MIRHRVNALAARHPRIQALVITWKASRKARTFVRVTFDGGDWIHRWRGGALVWHEPTLEPRAVTEIDLPLFTFAYRPKPGETVLDIGAGAGAEIGPFSRMVGPRGRVIAVEPDPLAFRRLTKLVRALGLKNVTLRQTAVGASEGTACLTQDGVAGATNRLDSDLGADGLAVPLTTLDALVEQLAITRVDYLKMNIEGSEKPALTGFPNQARIVRNWCVACHDFLGTKETATFSFVKAWLESAGLLVSRHPELDGCPWVGWYVYATSPLQ